MDSGSIHQRTGGHTISSARGRMAGNCIRTEAAGQDTAKAFASCLPTRTAVPPARGRQAHQGQSSRFKIKKPAASYFPAFSSIIGAEVLDFRVRNGNGYFLSTMATGI